MKKIVLKNESCIGCGACVGIDAEHFEFSDEGYSVVKSQENLDSPALADAIDACPVAIISVEDVNEETNEASSTCQKESVSEECHCGHECNCENEECECSCEDGDIANEEA